MKIKNGTEFNYNLYPKALTFDLPYDMGSIMHYHQGDFSVDGNLTMVPLDPLYDLSVGIGQFGMTFRDIYMLNSFYCMGRVWILSRNMNPDFKIRCLHTL